MSKLLLFAEDAGAATYMAPLLGPLSFAGIKVRLLSTSVAAERFDKWGIAFERLGAEEIESAVANADVVGTGTAINAETLGLKLVAMARAGGRPTIGFADSHQHMEWRFRGPTSDPLAYLPEWLIVSDKIAEMKALQIGCRQERIVVAGHPVFDRIRLLKSNIELVRRAQTLRQTLMGGETSRIVAFVTEPSVNVYGGSFQRNAEYTLSGDTRSEYRTDIVLHEFLRAIRPRRSKFKLVFRPHPASQKHEYSAHIEKFDTLYSGNDIYELILAADLVVGMTSIVLAEAALLGKPTLSIIPRPSEKDWSSAVLSGVTSAVWTRDQIENAFGAEIESLFRSPDTKLIEEFYPLGASDRIEKFVTALCSKSPVADSSCQVVPLRREN